YRGRFGVTLDPQSEVLTLIGSKEGTAHMPLAFVNPGDVVLVPDPGYPVYAAGTWFADGDVHFMPLRRAHGFLPDLDAIPAEVAKRARLMYLNYPNNPTGAVAPDGLFEAAVAFAQANDILVVHDASYTETTFDGYVAPSFLATPGAKEVGVEVFSLSKGYNMTGWRAAALVGNADAIEAYWRLKTNIDSGMFDAVQLAAAATLEQGDDFAREMSAVYQRRRDLVCDALREIGVDVTPPKGTIYIWAPVPHGYDSASYAEHVLEESAVVVSPGGAYGPNGEGFFRISLTVPDERLTEAVERLRASLSR
ncbi:MAG: aminotransferase class I/II-fold pyridoxal phosphate-dependent enzyme, partial [Actinomycetota bacterium]